MGQTKGETRFVSVTAEHARILTPLSQPGPTPEAPLAYTSQIGSINPRGPIGLLEQGGGFKYFYLLLPEYLDALARMGHDF